MKCQPGIQYDQTHHTGCACYEKRRADEMERLRAENERLRAAIVEIRDHHAEQAEAWETDEFGDESHAEYHREREQIAARALEGEGK